MSDAGDIELLAQRPPFSTSPIFLAIINRLDLLREQFGEIWLPPTVIEDYDWRKSCPAPVLCEEREKQDGFGLGR